MTISRAALISVLSSAISMEGLANTESQSIPFANPDALPQPKQQFRLPQSKLTPGVTPNVRCNNRVTCSDGRGLTQSETALAISGDVVVCGYNDFPASYCPNYEPGYKWRGWS